MLRRRDLLRAALAAAILPSAAARPRTGGAPRRREFCFFSKALPELGWRELGRAAREAGFDGIDLTVRAKGHVLPERAAEDLPRAIDAIRAHGLSVPMITTELTSVSDPTATPLLQAAATHGVRFFKTGYWHYTSPDVRAQVGVTGAALAGLSTLARGCGIELGFHNHAGYVGAALWDIAPAMDRLAPRWAGYYFDPRHAVAEGGGGAWKAATHLVLPRLKMLALKDFVWRKAEQGWRIEDCPLGDGAVDWAWMASALRDVRFAGPISVHLEYEIPSATAEEHTRRTIDAATRDLAFARRVLS
jgi:L-ribulose-5-phosphate 3-epimerase